MVVEGSKFIKSALQCAAVGNDELPEQRLERAKQTLDTPVLPRGMFLSGLMPDACELEEGVEHIAVEDGFVVGAEFAAAVGAQCCQSASFRATGECWMSRGTT